MLYYILSITCVTALIVMAAVYLAAFRKKDREGKIELIGKFKTGSCVFVYLFAIPLYWLGYVYAGQNFLDAFFDAVAQSVSLVVLGYDVQGISALMKDNWAYRVAIYVCFFLVIVNAALLILSLLHRKIWVFLQTRGWEKSCKDKLLIVGNNAESLKIYTSEKNRDKMVLDDLSDEEKNSLYLKNVQFISRSRRAADGKTEHDEIERYAACLFERAMTSAQKCIIIINQQDDEANISLCHALIACTKKVLAEKSDDFVTDALTRVKAYVFGNPTYEAVYHSLEENSYGCIRCVNKYRQIAIDFIDRYPLTAFMTEKQIDYKTALLKSEVRVNVAMIGFGKTNSQIFLSSVANNQFMTEEKGVHQPKQVTYHIFDKAHLENDKNLNHSYYRYKNELGNATSAEDYLPLPAMPAIEHYGKMDVNSPSFYQDLRKALSGEHSFNYVIIGFGSDLENLDMAYKIIEKKTEWKLDDTYIFVKIRSGQSDYVIFERNDCYMIGDEDRIVYHIDRIDNDALTSMAKMRNRIYNLEYAITSAPNQIPTKSVERIYAEADLAWYIKKTQFERESNVYACLALRSRLHMMGLDYCKASDSASRTVLSESGYMNVYAGEDMPDYLDGISADRKPIVNYNLRFEKSRRKTLAELEHLRWNAFMITKGFVPAKKSEILADTAQNGKNYTLRKHGNLTDFEGLVEFRRMVAARDGKDERATDVIKYDYQLLDDAFWLLTQNGYQIVSRGQ